MSNYGQNPNQNQGGGGQGMNIGFPGGSQIQNQLMSGGQGSGQNSGNPNYSHQQQSGGVSMQNMGFSQPTQGQNSPAGAMGTGTNGTSNSSTSGDPGNSGTVAIQNQQQQPQQKELNAASLCRFGQETVQELVNRAQEIFQCLRVLQPPDGRAVPPTADRKPKIQETVRNVKALFKRLRVIYEKIEESFPSSEIMEGEIEGLIPYKHEMSVLDIDDRKNSEAYKAALEENREVIEQVTLKNRHLKDVIDHLRQIIWDVNTMLAMRKE